MFYNEYRNVSHLLPYLVTRNEENVAIKGIVIINLCKSTHSAFSPVFGRGIARDFGVNMIINQQKSNISGNSSLNFGRNFHDRRLRS